MDRVLVAADDRDILALLVTLLVAEGYDARGVTRECALLRLARDWRSDAIVLDLALLHRDNAELIWRLRTDPATAHIPVIALAEPDGQAYLSRCWSLEPLLPVHACVPSPFEVSELCATVAHWIAAGREAGRRAGPRAAPTGGPWRTPRRRLLRPVMAGCRRAREGRFWLQVGDDG